MRTAPLLVGRVLALVLGLLLAVGGLASMAWSIGVLANLLAGTPETISTEPVTTALDQTWLPWALGAAGLVLATLALWWIVALVPRPVRHLQLPGSDESGRLSVDAAQAASAVARLLAVRVGGTEDHGIVSREGRTLVIESRVRMPPNADLHRTAAAADETDATMRDLLARPDLAYRAVIRVADAEPHGSARVT